MKISVLKAESESTCREDFKTGDIYNIDDHMSEPEWLFKYFVAIITRGFAFLYIGIDEGFLSLSGKDI